MFLWEYLLCNTEYILVIFDIWSNGFFGPMVFYLFGPLVSTFQQNDFVPIGTREEKTEKN